MPQEKAHLAKYVFYTEDLFVYVEAQPKNSSGPLRGNISDL